MRESDRPRLLSPECSLNTEPSSPRAIVPIMPIDLQLVPGAVWTALHVKPRCEKMVADYCHRFNVPHYLPLQRRAKRFQRRNVVSFLPMFHGYLFAPLTVDQRTLVLDSHRVVRLLATDPETELQLLHDLGQVQLMEQAQETNPLQVNPELTPGTPVRITSGPLQGLEGVVERRPGVTRIWVNVELLGQSVATELDAGELETLE